MRFHWILKTRFHRSTNHQLDLPVDLETCVRLAMEFVSPSHLIDQPPWRMRLNK